MTTETTKHTRKPARASLEHYTRLDAASMNHTHPDCGCRLARDEMGAVALYHCPTHAAAPEMAAEIRSLAHDIEEMGCTCADRTQGHQVNCQGVAHARNARALLRRLES